MALGHLISKKLLDFQLQTLRKRVCAISGKRWMSNYFITTPIFYVNAEPHIGHLYTVTIADAISRFKKLKNSGCNVRFMVGTDEHGLKVSQAAKNAEVEVHSYCDKISAKYKDLFHLFSIESDDFVRTTEERHVRSAVALWNKISAGNYIYQGKYEGWYCIKDEVFISEKYLEPASENSDVRFTIEDRKPVQHVSEMNYKFKLSQFENDLLYWLKSGSVITPKIFQDILHKWIIDGFMSSDISLSRPAARVPWGIPVPGDPSQTMYVWFDALSSYLSSNGYPDSNFKWPPDVQVIGKDILKFHGIFWPAFLIAAGLEPPKCILCHSHWLKDSEKISKSKGNIIDPFKEVNTFTSDGLRYFLLRSGVPHSDGNFTQVKVSNTLNSELADTLGNLLIRCTSDKININRTFPVLVEDDMKKYSGTCSDNLINSLKGLPDTVERYYEEFNFYKGIDAIIGTLHLTNKFFDSEKPWDLRKSDNNKARLDFVNHLTMESLRVCGILLQPIIPNVAGRLLDKLSIGKQNRSLPDVKPFSWDFKNESQNLSLSQEYVMLFSKIR